jgi:hypothetical protein
LVFDATRRRDQPIATEDTWFAVLRDRLRPQVQALPGLPPEQLEPALDGLLLLGANIAAGERLAEAMLPESLRGALAAPTLQVLQNATPAFQEQQRYLARTAADFLTLLRGDDAERARFLAEYPFDVSAATDDAPFFFNYYRWSSLFGSGKERQGGDALFNYHTDFPVGHLVLLGSMLQILLLAALFIFLPLRKLASAGLRTPGVLGIFGYFAALGLGFMLIEIALMQKLVIFLGHPTYALSVVLTSLLAAAGTGSLLAGRIERVQSTHLRTILIGIVAVVALDVAAVNWLLPHLLGLPLAARIAVVLALLVPTGLVLGMPFPSGMRIVQEKAPALVPWGWAVNAFFSVFGSIFCIVLSMGIGFSNVFWVALAVYVLGLTGLRRTVAA